MTFKKPKDITYTQMAIWIDNNVYLNNCDNNKVFEYLYYLSYMLASKNKYFSKKWQYDEFSIYCATYVYLRYRNDNQFILDKDGNPKLTQLKSCLNYLKKVIYPVKVQYEQQTYKQVYSVDIYSKENKLCTDLNLDWIDYVEKNTKSLFNVEFTSYLEDIPKTVKDYVDKLPTIKNTSYKYNIYKSVLLTLLNDISLLYVDIDKLNNIQSEYVKQKVLYNLYSSQKYSQPFLYHIDQNLSSYLRLIVNCIKDIIKKDLQYILNQDIPIQDLFNDYSEQIQTGDNSLYEEEY